jgi:hypothetical protein
MSTNHAVEPNPSPGDPSTAPVRTRYNDEADAFVAKIGAMKQAFPVKFLTRHRTTARLVDARIRVPLKCLSTGVAAIERSTDLQSVTRIDAAESRDQLQLLEAFVPALLEAEQLYLGMKFTMNSVRADLANNILKLYAVAKTLGRDGEDPELAALAETISRELGLKGIGKSKKDKKQPEAPSSNGAPVPSVANPTVVN